MIRIGCAGWSLPRGVQPRFPPGDSHLARYAQALPAVEINSSFHRPHTQVQYARWADAVPPGFRFSVKLPRELTHARRLAGCEDLLSVFLQQVAGLGGNLDCLLVQLPPSLAYDARIAPSFLASLRHRHAGGLAVEPRHASWFDADADALLQELRIARVLADPVRHAAGRMPGGWDGLVYLRLHGSPRMYYSAYAPALLRALAARMQAARDAGAQVWCIFDNTATGAATDNALDLLRLLEEGR